MEPLEIWEAVAVNRGWLERSLWPFSVADDILHDAYIGAVSSILERGIEVRGDLRDYVHAIVSIHRVNWFRRLARDQSLCEEIQRLDSRSGFNDAEDALVRRLDYGHDLAQVIGAVEAVHSPVCREILKRRLRGEPQQALMDKYGRRRYFTSLSRAKLEAIVELHKSQRREALMQKRHHNDEKPH